MVFVSTMSVIPVATVAAAASWDGADQELVPPSCAVGLESGYAQSKLVAEHHLAAAAAEGKIRLVIARLGLLGAARTDGVTDPNPNPNPNPEGLSPSSRLAGRRDWLSLLLCAVETTGSSPAGLAAGGRSVAVLPVNVAAAALAEHAASALGEPRCEHMEPPRCEHVEQPRCGHVVVTMDAEAFAIAPRPLSDLLDEVQAARGNGAVPLRRELPYPVWRQLVAAAGPPAALVLAVLPPPESRGGALRLPSGARRRLRDIKRRLTTTQ